LTDEFSDNLALLRIDGGPEGRGVQRVFVSAIQAAAFCAAWTAPAVADTLAYSSYNSSMVPYSMQVLNRLMGMSH